MSSLCLPFNTETETGQMYCPKIKDRTERAGTEKHCYIEEKRNRVLLLVKKIHPKI
jgi:hypothetical protein